MDDLISRQAAISAICSACGKIDCDKMDKCEKLQLPPANCSEFPNSSDTISRQAAIEACGGYLVPANIIKQLPPAQLGMNLAEVGTDCISRQALLDKFEPWLKVKDYNDGELNMLKAVLYEIRFMRPAQPEPSQVAADIARIVENGQDMRVIEAAQPTPDQNGDLWITVPDIDEVTCIYVQESKSKFCRIFYEEQEQPERIKGRWIEITSSNHTYKCSVCGRLLVNIIDGKNKVAKNYPYCHCGADMREVTE